MAPNLFYLISRLLLLFFILIVSQLQGQPAFSTLTASDSSYFLVGKIENYATKTTISARVKVEQEPGGNNVYFTSSDSTSGAYSIKIPKIRPYSVVYSAPGYFNDYQKLSFTYDSAKTLTKKQINVSLVPIKIGETIPFNRILFDVNSYALNVYSLPDLNRLLQLLVDYPKLKIRLEGHTDSQGKSGKNMRLSKNRIVAMKKYFTSKGIKGNRIKLKAYGGKMPLAKGDSPEIRKMNRRVEIRILEI